MIKLDKSALEATNTFLTAGSLEKEYKKQREAAKESLIAALGVHTDGILPDGRQVSKTIAHFEEATYTRKAYDSTTVSVSALSTSDVRDELAKLAVKKNTSPHDAGKPLAKAKHSTLKARVGK